MCDSAASSAVRTITLLLQVRKGKDIQMWLAAVSKTITAWVRLGCVHIQVKSVWFVVPRASSTLSEDRQLKCVSKLPTFELSREHKVTLLAMERNPLCKD